MRVSFLPNPPNKGPPASLYTGVPSSLAQASGSNIMPILPESPYRAQHRLLVRFCVMKKSCSPAVLSSNVFSEQGRRAVLTCPKSTLPWKLPAVGAMEGKGGGHSAPPSTVVQAVH